MTDFDLTVSTRRFRGALIAVLPHVSTDKDDMFLTRVRVYVSPDHLVVAATDRFTAAMAWVPVDASTGEVGCFDMTPTDVQQILAVHRIPKEGSYDLRLGHDGKHLRATDISGLGFGGKSLRLEALSVDKTYPDVPNLISRVATSADLARGSVRDAQLNQVWGAGLARFTVAAKVFEEFLIVEAIGRPRAVLISCGTAFLGVLIPTGDADDVSEDEHRLRKDAIAAASVARLGHPEPPEVKAHRDATEVQDLSDLIPISSDDEKGGDSDG